MANTKSAIKRIRISRKRAARNRVYRSSARTFVKKAKAAILEGATPEEQMEALRRAIRALDVAAERGVLHKNNAARRKSRLMKLYNKVQQQAQA
ncbi:MAG: 30S ribosomal protein S20 [Anaerolineales bacterium]